MYYFSYYRENNSTMYFFICWTFRFMSASVEHNIQTYILELVHDQLTRRQTLDSITRNLLKLLTVTCGYSQIRLLVSQRLEMWLQNPKVCICLFVCLFVFFSPSCCMPSGDLTELSTFISKNNILARIWAGKKTGWPVTLWKEFFTHGVDLVVFLHAVD